MSTLVETLRGLLPCPVLDDAFSKKIYSVDASIYEIEPLAVVVPHTKEDVIMTVCLAAEHKVPLIGRGAATGIVGGCIGRGIILDFSQYLNKILHIDYEKEYALCEPGVVQNHLNDAVAERGYRLGPDTSTGNRATIGGMVGNNSAGANSLRYGKMVDHVEEVELVLSCGQVLRFGEVDEATWKEKCRLEDREGQIYRAVDAILHEYADDIEAHYPKIPRRVTGYNLDELLKPGPKNLAKIIVGAEGSLGIVTEVKVKISPKPAVTGLCVLNYRDLVEAFERIPAILPFKPFAFEIVDSEITKMAMVAPAMRGKLDWLDAEAAALLIVQFDGASEEEVGEKLERFEHVVKEQQLSRSHTLLTTPTQMSWVWDLRKSGLGLLMSRRTYSRAIGFVEDISVAPEKLAPFIREFQKLLQRYGKEAGIYGHAGSGCIHLRPYVDLRQQEEVDIIRSMLEDVSEILLRYGGALSGEHGDGLIRSWLNEKMFGKRVYEAFKKLKDAFDPAHLANPGKVVDGPPVDNDLRLSPQSQLHSFDTFLNFDKEGGFALAVDMCNGNAFCRKQEGLMCPSYQATLDEKHSTRGRAQSLRALVHGRLPQDAYTSQELYDILDLCLECKGCKTQCPSQVDMAKLKAEFLYHYQQRHGFSWRSRLFGHVDTLGYWGSLFAPLSNMFNKFSSPFLGLTPHRPLPPFAWKPFSSWLKKAPSPSDGPPVVLFVDTYAEYHEPALAQAAYRLLLRMGYNVQVVARQCCGRPLLSKGFLEQARAKAEALTKRLQPFADRGIPIVGLEPSCILTMQDDYESLLNKEKTPWPTLCMTLDEFLAREDKELPLSLQERSVRVHVHCHQKSLVGSTPTLQVLQKIPQWDVQEIPSGCCGMAGSFGYEQEHYELSMKIGEQVLFPSIRATDDGTLVIANGFSCRHQITQGTQRHALHLGEALALGL